MAAFLGPPSFKILMCWSVQDTRSTIKSLSLLYSTKVVQTWQTYTEIFELGRKKFWSKLGMTWERTWIGMGMIWEWTRNELGMNWWWPKIWEWPGSEVGVKWEWSGSDPRMIWEWPGNDVGVSWEWWWSENGLEVGMWWGGGEKVAVEGRLRQYYSSSFGPIDIAYIYKVCWVWVGFWLGVTRWWFGITMGLVYSFFLETLFEVTPL